MIVRTRATQLVVKRLPSLGSTRPPGSRGIVLAGGRCLPCALGRGGIKALKREGDGATPLGVFEMRGVFFRRDRVQPPRGGLRGREIKPRDGWCDSPGDRNYNRPVRHPYPASAERMWRDDGLYDLVGVIGYNDLPRVRGRGSAIFLHVANGSRQRGFKPTEGCVALERCDVAWLMSRLSRRSRLVVLP